jgi:hypothetical protein
MLRLVGVGSRDQLPELFGFAARFKRSSSSNKTVPLPRCGWDVSGEFNRRASLSALLLAKIFKNIICVHDWQNQIFKMYHIQFSMSLWKGTNITTITNRDTKESHHHKPIWQSIPFKIYYSLLCIYTTHTYSHITSNNGDLWLVYLVHDLQLGFRHFRPSRPAIKDKLNSMRLIPRSWWSSNGLNRVFILIILGVSPTPPLGFFFFTNLLANAKFQCKKRGLFTHIVTWIQCHHPLTKQTF